jgi:hypothetical protein
MHNPSGFCGMSSVSKSDLAFTIAASRLSATIEMRSKVACASSLGLVRKNSMVKFITRLLSALRQVYHGKEGLGVDLIDRRLCRICKAANILLNLRRRHIDKSQRAMVGGRIANLEDSRRQNGAFFHASAGTAAPHAVAIERSVQVIATVFPLRALTCDLAMIGAVFTLKSASAERSPLIPTP